MLAAKLTTIVAVGRLKRLITLENFSSGSTTPKIGLKIHPKFQVGE